MDGPLGELDASLERMNISRSQIIQGIYLVDANDQQQLHDQLEKDKNEGIKERDEDKPLSILISGFHDILTNILFFFI